jgi:hypothetical protein
VRPGPHAPFAGRVQRVVVVAHWAAAFRAGRDLLEQIRKIPAFAAALRLLPQKRGVLCPVEQCTVDDLGIVAGDDLAPYFTVIQLEFSDVLANNPRLQSTLWM